MKTERVKWCCAHCDKRLGRGMHYWYQDKGTPPVCPSCGCDIECDCWRCRMKAAACGQ